MPALVAASPPFSASGAALGQAEVRRVHVEGVHGAVATLGDLGVAGRRDLVEAVGPVHDPRARRAEHHQRARQELGELGARHADDLPRRARGIGERSEQVERRPQAELAPCRARMAHRRMKRRREEERDARLAQAALHHRGGAATLTPSASNTSALPH
jgi:hypothetical protein